MAIQLTIQADDENFLPRQEIESGLNGWVNKTCLRLQDFMRTGAIEKRNAILVARMRKIQMSVGWGW